MSVFVCSRKVRIILAVVTAVLTFAAAAYIYGTAFPLVGDEKSLSQAILEASYHPRFHRMSNIDAEILGVAQTTGGLAAFFRNRNHDHVFGFAFFERGWNRRYTLTGYQKEFVPYSSFVLAHRFSFDGVQMIAGYNTGVAHTFGITVHSHSHVGQGQVEIIFPVESERFLLALSEPEIRERAGLTGEHRGVWIHGTGTLYSEDGNDITDNYFVEGVADYGLGGRGIGRANINGSLIFLMLGSGFIIVKLLLRDRHTKEANA